MLSYCVCHKLCALNENHDHLAEIWVRCELSAYSPALAVGLDMLVQAIPHEKLAGGFVSVRTGAHSQPEEFFGVLANADIARVDADRMNTQGVVLAAGLENVDDKMNILGVGHDVDLAGADDGVRSQGEGLDVGPVNVEDVVVGDLAVSGDETGIQQEELPLFGLGLVDMMNIQLLKFVLGLVVAGRMMDFLPEKPDLEFPLTANSEKMTKSLALLVPSFGNQYCFCRLRVVMEKKTHAATHRVVVAFVVAVCVGYCALPQRNQKFPSVGLMQNSLSFSCHAVPQHSIEMQKERTP